MVIKPGSLLHAILFSLIGSAAFGAEPVLAEEAPPPAAKSEAPATAEPPAAEPVETLQKKSAPPEVVDPKDKPATGNSDTSPKPVRPADKPPTNLQDQLLEGLGLQGQAEAAGNPLDAIVERMRNVQQRLQKTETDQPTRDLQTQIVKDLDDLIEKLKNQKPPPPNPNQSQSPPPPMGDSPPDTPPRGGAQPKPQNSQKQQGDSSGQQQSMERKQQQQPQESAAEQKSRGKSRDSDNQLRQGRSVEEEAARQRMAKDVWGHLPASLRQELLNVYSEKFLPKYDDMVRKYYEALAEQNRRNP